MYNEHFWSLLIFSNLMDSLVPDFYTILKEVLCTKLRNKLGARLFCLPQRPSAANSYYNPRAVRVHPPVRKSSISTRKPSLKNITFNVFAYSSETNED